LLWPAGALDTPARPPPAAGRSRANVCVVPDRRQRTTVMPPGRSAGAGLSVRNGLVLPSSLPNLFRRLTSGRYIPTHRRSRRIHDQRGQASPKAPRDPPHPSLPAPEGCTHRRGRSGHTPLLLLSLWGGAPLWASGVPPFLGIATVRAFSNHKSSGSTISVVGYFSRKSSAPVTLCAIVFHSFHCFYVSVPPVTVWPSYPRSASDERTASGGLLTLDPPGL